MKRQRVAPEPGSCAVSASPCSSTGCCRSARFSPPPSWWRRRWCWAGSCQAQSPAPLPAPSWTSANCSPRLPAGCSSTSATDSYPVLHSPSSSRQSASSFPQSSRGTAGSWDPLCSPWHYPISCDTSCAAVTWAWRWGTRGTRWSGSAAPAWGWSRRARSRSLAPGADWQKNHALYAECR